MKTNNEQMTRADKINFIIRTTAFFNRAVAASRLRKSLSLEDDVQIDCSYAEATAQWEC